MAGSPKVDPPPRPRHCAAMADAQHGEQRIAGIAALAATVAMWGFSAVAIKAVSTSGLVTATYRLWFAIPLLWLTMLAPSMRRRLKPELLRASIIGGVLFSIHQALYFTSLKLTSVANVTIIGALQPALVLLVAGPMFGERATRRSLLWSGVAFVGTAMVVLGSARVQSSSALGDVLAFVNLFAFTAYFLASKRFRAGIGAWEYVVGMTTVSGIVVLVLTVSTTASFGRPTPREWLILAAIAVFPGTLGHVLSNWAHAHVSAFVASMILLAVPVLAVGGAWLVLDERVGALQMAGGVLVLVSIATIVRSARKVDAEDLVEGAAFGEAP